MDTTMPPECCGNYLRSAVGICLSFGIALFVVGVLPCFAPIDQAHAVEYPSFEGAPCPSTSDHTKLLRNKNVYVYEKCSTEPSLLKFPWVFTYARWRANGKKHRSILIDDKFYDSSNPLQTLGGFRLRGKYLFYQIGESDSSAEPFWQGAVYSRDLFTGKVVKQVSLVDADEAETRSVYYRANGNSASVSQIFTPHAESASGDWYSIKIFNYRTKRTRSLNYFEKLSDFGLSRDRKSIVWRSQAGKQSTPFR